MSLHPKKARQYMDWCLAGAEVFATCGKRQYMAILLDARHRVVGVGYNGGPARAKHCVDGGCPRLAENSPPGSNYDNCIAIHAEQNAFLNSVSDARILIVNGPPCYTCAKMIVNSSVEAVYFLPDESYDQWIEVQSFMTKNKVRTIPVASK